MIFPNVSVVDENVVEIRKVDLLIDDENILYRVDFYFESDLQHISGNLYRFTPSNMLREIVDGETSRWTTVDWDDFKSYVGWLKETMETVTPYWSSEVLESYISKSR